MKFYLKNSLALIFILLIISCNKDVVLKPTNTFLEDDQNQVSVPIPLGAKELLSIIKKEVGDIKDEALNSLIDKQVKLLNFN
mgnify:CR=1 FL=1